MTMRGYRLDPLGADPPPRGPGGGVPVVLDPGYLLETLAPDVLRAPASWVVVELDGEVRLDAAGETVLVPERVTLMLPLRAWLGVLGRRDNDDELRALGRQVAQLLARE